MKKKVFKILIITFLALNIPIIYVHSETLNLIEEKLDSVGVPDEYSNNIVNYITNLKLSTEETKNLLEDINNIISKIKEKEDYNDFTFTELLNIYGEALNIADELNINLDLDLSTKEVVLKDKDSKLTLIKCDVNDIKRYYENYKVSPLTSQDYEILKSYIVENTIINDENTNNSERSNNSNDMTKVDDYSNSDLNESDDYNNSNLNDEEIAKNSKRSDSSDSSENNNETLNTVSTIKSKNMNRVLSIVFLVLFACVVVSLLIESIFFNEKK